jgi:uncharacterized protein (TIGR01244 family)
MMNTNVMILIGLGVLAVIGIILYWRFVAGLPRNFGAVKEGVLYRSGQGTLFQLKRAINQYGLKTIICLRSVKPEKPSGWFEAEKSLADKMGVKFIHYPMVSKELTEDEKYWIDMLMLTQDDHAKPILVHCAQGELRTGFFCAIYRMVVDNWTVEQTIKEMESFGYNLRGHKFAVRALSGIKLDEARKKFQQVNPEYQNHPS